MDQAAQADHRETVSHEAFDLLLGVGALGKQLLQQYHSKRVADFAFAAWPADAHPSFPALGINAACQWHVIQAGASFVPKEAVQLLPKGRQVDGTQAS
eukprot:821687-Lingulodinium_polyedra.AAC.1